MFSLEIGGKSSQKIKKKNLKITTLGCYIESYKENFVNYY